MQDEDPGIAASIDSPSLRVGITRATRRGRWLGAQLRQHREAAGRKAVEAAKSINRSAGTISRWESGDLLPRRSDVYYLLVFYEVQADERDALTDFAEKTQLLSASSVEVSHAPGDHAWEETRAWKVDTFQNAVIPGLLQTADYAREVLAAWNPAATTEWIESAITARAARQRRLTGLEPLQLFAILDEAVLRRPIGGPDMMRAQLDYLVERAKLPNVEIRVLPLAAGAHASLSGSFDIMQFRDEHDLVYLETRGGHIYLDHPGPFVNAWPRLEAVALPEEKSVAMIGAVYESL